MAQSPQIWFVRASEGKYCVGYVLDLFEARTMRYPLHTMVASEHEPRLSQWVNSNVLFRRDYGYVAWSVI